jgi:hypothetical protein
LGRNKGYSRIVLLLGIIGKATKPLFRRKNICRQRQILSPWKVTTVESDIIWQDSSEKESATAKLNTWLINP